MTTTTTTIPTRLDPTLESPLSEVQRRFRRDTHAPQAARNFTADVLAGNDIDADTIDTAKLLVSETVTNAALYADRGTITVAITISDKQIRFDITDAGHARADVALTSDFDDASEHGRGWFMVTTLAADCGIERVGAGDGNRVFFVLDRDLRSAS